MPQPPTTTPPPPTNAPTCTTPTTATSTCATPTAAAPTTPTGTAPTCAAPATDQLAAVAETGERGNYEEVAVSEAIVDSTADRRTVDRRERRERGAITAEYAIAIVSACALGGVLISIVRSPGMQNAFKTIINYALKLAGVEGVHL